MKKRVSKRLFLVVLTVLLWAGLLTSGVRALLTDSAILSTNTLTIGSAGLLVSNSQSGSSTVFEKVREGFSFAMIPGSTESRYFLLKNTSSENMPLAIQCSALYSPTIEQTLLSKTTITFVPVDADGNDLPGASHVGGTLGAMYGGSSLFYGVIQPGKQQRYKITVSVSLDFDVPEASVVFDLLFTGTQAV
jgi:hypothetical protein